MTLALPQTPPPVPLSLPTQHTAPYTTHSPVHYTLPLILAKRLRSDASNAALQPHARSKQG